MLTFRTDDVGARLARLLADIDRARYASEIPLRPLDQADVAAMLGAIFGADSAFDSTFIARLHALTEGNPFFVEEVLKALVVDGDLVRTGDTWHARPLEQVRVPRLRGRAEIALLERYERHALDEVLFALTVGGLSQRRVVDWVRRLLGGVLSPATIHQVLTAAREQIEQRRNAPIPRGRYRALVLDAAPPELA